MNLAITDGGHGGQRHVERIKPTPALDEMKSRGAAEDHSDEQDQANGEAPADVHRTYSASQQELRCIVCRAATIVKREQMARSRSGRDKFPCQYKKSCWIAMVSEIGHGGGLSVAFRARQIEDDLLRLVVRFFLDGAVRMQELVGDVSENGSAARPDAALGYLDEETGEELANVGAGGEFGKFGEQIGGKVDGVTGGRREGGRDRMKVARTKAGLGFQPGQRAALAIGEAIMAAGGTILGQSCRDFQGGAVICDGGVHDFPRSGVCTPRSSCRNLKTQGLQKLMAVSV